jgi:hypothetical protein
MMRDPQSKENEYGEYQVPHWSVLPLVTINETSARIQTSLYPSVFNGAILGDEIIPRVVNEVELEHTMPFVFTCTPYDPGEQI